MTKKLKWRLGKLPSPDEVTTLLNREIITKEEAREILFSEEDEKIVDIKALQTEIEFLRKLVEKLSNRSTIIEHITTIQKPYYQYDWYRPYMAYCGSTIAGGAGGGYVGGAGSHKFASSAGVAGNGLLQATNANFSEIKTF